MAKKKAINEGFSNESSDAKKLGDRAQYDRDFRDRLTRSKGWVRGVQTKSAQWNRWNP
jgi:hypothetical protein